MLFFCMRETCLESSFEMISQTIKKLKKKLKNYYSKKVVTLQVRIPFTKISFVRKRVSLSVSFSGSMTVEAAFVLPLFLFSGVLLLMPFRILDVERQVQAHLETVGEEISQNAYFSMENIKGKEVLTTAVAYGYAENALRSGLSRLPVSGISLASSSLLLDGETVDLVIYYDIRLPFSIFGINHVKCMGRCYRRAWIGREGIHKPKEMEEYMEENMVYIGKGSTRYHESRTCHYLYNDLKAVLLTEIETYRSKEGRRYTVCARCGSAASDTVYIMESGSHYHSSASCTAIQAYVEAVPRSQVEYLGACSYCSRGK